MPNDWMEKAVLVWREWLMAPPHVLYEQHLAAALEAENKAGYERGIEDAAKVAEGHMEAWDREWRDVLKTDSHMEGKSDGADDIASAIRRLSVDTPGQEQPR